MELTLVYPGCHPAGGVERVVWEAARYLSAAHRVTVVTAWAAELPEAVNLVQTPSGPSSESFRSNAEAAIGQRPGMVVSFGTDCPAADVLVMGSVHRAWLEAGAAVRVGRVRVPGEVRWLLPRHRTRLRGERQALKALRGPAVACSERVRSDLHRLYRLPLERIEVVPNGFDPAQCSPARRSELRPKMRAELGLSEDMLTLLLVANEYHRKGLGVLLDAMAALAEPGLVLLLVGRMAPTAFAARIRQLGLEANVRYCGPTDDVASYHAAADIFVLPTQYEPFGNVIVEALASGLPVITSRLAGAAAAIEPGRNGLLLENPLDADELAGLLRRGLDATARRAWSEGAPGSVDGFEWSSIMARFEAVLCRAWEGSMPTEVHQQASVQRPAPLAA